MGRIFGLIAQGGSKLIALAMGAGGLAAGESYVNGEQSFVRRLFPNVFGTMSTAQAQAGVEGSFHGFFKFFEMIAKMIQRTFGEGPISNAMGNWAQRNMGKTESFGNGNVMDDRTPAFKPTPDLNKLSVPAPAASGPPTTHTEAAVQLASQVTGLNENEVKLGAASVTAGASAAGLVALKTGARTIPLVASFAAAADGAWDVGKYALNGEWKKAGVRAASAAVETVGGVFGGASYAFGLAGREAVEMAGEAALGKEAALPDSELLSLAKKGYEFVKQ